MKNILCFGDSNTYGLRPDNGDRYGSDVRWTGILSKKLGTSDYRVVEEGEIILVSPIHLGEKVWQNNYDPEFNQHSVVISKELKAVFRKLAEEYDCKFLAASDVAKPSELDQEHMDAKSHELLAGAIYEKLVKI